MARLAIVTLCLVTLCAGSLTANEPTSDATLSPFAQAQSNVEGNSIYHEGWIDLNKNGVKDPYEDSSQDIDTRVEDLLNRMTLDEKTCQMATLYGYPRVLKDEFPSDKWLTKLWKDGIGNIDEHANGNTNYGRKIEDPVSDLRHASHALSLIHI